MMTAVLRGACALAVFLLLLPAPVPAQDSRLGSLFPFPNSGAAVAQEAFQRGVLLLHSFEYGEAAEAFRSAQRADPGFALAHWGEAMTYTHPLWNEQDAPAARAVLVRLGASRSERRARAGTPREQLYLDAVEALYGEGPKARRDTLYAEAMARLVAAHPDDHEARALHALALMGLSQGVRDIPTYIRAGAVALELLERNPDHPGAAHYVIHAFDDPTHAPLALRAARAYSRIAPGAAHAQHMTTHIFLALGMWDDVVAQNVVASGPLRERWRPGHYTAWLGYGLLQQGRFEDAREHLALVHGNLGQAAGPGPRSYFLSMRAEYVVNSGRWDAPELDWPVATEGAWPVSLAADLVARGLAARARGAPASVDAALAELAAQRQRTAPAIMAGLPRTQVALMHDQLDALRQLDRGDAEPAVDRLRRAAMVEDSLPVEFGPPSVVKPSWELLGDVLLGLGRPAEARDAYRRALMLAPGRLRSREGLAAATAQALPPPADR